MNSHDDSTTPNCQFTFHRYACIIMFLLYVSHWQLITLAIFGNFVAFSGHECSNDTQARLALGNVVILVLFHFY